MNKDDQYILYVEPTKIGIYKRGFTDKVLLPYQVYPYKLVEVIKDEPSNPHNPRKLLEVWDTNPSHFLLEPPSEKSGMTFTITGESPEQLKEILYLYLL